MTYVLHHNYTQACRARLYRCGCVEDSLSSLRHQCPNAWALGGKEALISFVQLSPRARLDMARTGSWAACGLACDPTRACTSDRRGQKSSQVNAETKPRLRSDFCGRQWTFQRDFRDGWNWRHSFEKRTFASMIDLKEGAGS